MQLSVCLSHTVKEETTEMMTHDDPSYENGNHSNYDGNWDAGGTQVRSCPELFMQSWQGI